MTVTERLHKALNQRLKKETLYAVARDSGVNYDTLHRFVRNEEQQLRSANIDALCGYLDLELKAKRTAKPVAAKRKR